MSINTTTISFNGKTIYRHVCSNRAELNTIPENQITLGSSAIVGSVEGQQETYFADSRKKWNIVAMSTEATIDNSFVHICTTEEYNSETGLPTIEEPLSDTIYLVPTNNEVNHQFDEYIWVDNEWQLIGTRTINTAVNLPFGGNAGDKLTKETGDSYDLIWSQEGDPTVPAWAKATNKPTYTAEEVGAIEQEDFEELYNYIHGEENNPPLIATDLNNYYYTKNEINNIINNVAELPAVTAADNNSVLQVINGEWTLVKVTNASGVDF